MKKPVLLALMILVASSCASKRDVASTQEDVQTKYHQDQHARMIEGSASRIR